MLKKSRLAALLLACAVSVASAAPAFADEAAGDEAEPYYTHELPGSVKIGEFLYDEHPTESRYPITIHNLIPGKFCGVSYNTSFTCIGSTEATSSIYNNHVIFADHSAGYYNIREIPESGDFSCESPTSGMISFITPGTICIDVGYRYYEKAGNLLDGIKPISDRQAVGEPIIIEVEAPVIETNAPKSIEVGSTLQFTTELTNTALSNNKTAIYLDESNYNEYGYFIGETGDTYPSHTPAYQPSVEIIEGQDLVEQSNQDYTNTLKSSEELTFTGAGTVKLKVTYNMFVTCPHCQQREGINEAIYNPEEIITIEVTDGTSEPSDEAEPYYTHTYPESVKIGESFPSIYGGSRITIHNLIPETILGVDLKESFICSDSNEVKNYYEVAFNRHIGGPGGSVKVPESGVLEFSSRLGLYDSFVFPGTICIDVGYQPYERVGELGDVLPIGERQTVGDPIKIEVEAPVIETNAPKSIQVGSTLQFTTELTNTALSNKEVAPYLDESNYREGEFIGRCDHQPAYQPSVEIIEGQDLVKQSNQDYTNTLKSSEKLAFTGAGTVKLKVTYNQLVTCPDQQKGSPLLYNPEEIITIEVTDGSTEPSEPSEDEVKYETAEGITIEGDSLFPDGTVVKAETVTTGDVFNTAKTALSNIAEKISVFDLSAFKGETAVQPSGNVKVTFDVPDDFSDSVSLYYVSDSGEAEKIEAVFDKKARTLTAELKHFSVYVLADEETKPAADTTNEGTKPDDGNPGTGVAASLYPLLAVTGVSGAALLAAALRKRRS